MRLNLSGARADDYEIVPATSVGLNEPRRWIKVGEKISLKWFAKKRVLYRDSITWPCSAEHDRAVVARRAKRRGGRDVLG